MVRAPVIADAFHGATGLGSLPIVEPAARAAPQHAVNFIVETVMGRPEGTVTLGVLGPMSNVAMAMRLEPRLAARLHRIVFMGGARREGGNITASAEYNVHADPHAAQIVFDSGVPVTVMGLDATLQVRSTEDRIALLRALPSARAQAAAHLLNWSRENELKVVGWPAPPLHDPCVVAYLLRPELFTLEPVRLDVETTSPLSLGHTAVEFRLKGREPNAHWCTAVDADGLYSLLAERLA
jgi:purine nucleosidase